MRNNRWLQGCLTLVFIGVSAAQAQEIAKPEGLLLRGFESEALKNRRGFEAVENGVLTTVRVDAAGELSATRTAAEIEPHIDWYQARNQRYLAYGVFDGANLSYLADPTDESLYIVNVEGEVTSDLNISHPDVLAAIVEAAKAYVDIGVDGIEYDVDGWARGLGSFDERSLAAFNTWLTDTKEYPASELESIFETAVDSTFNYRTFLASKGVTTDSETLANVSQSAHFRLWRGFINYQERETSESLIDSLNTYSSQVQDKTVELYFNRYGFFDTPSRRWNSIGMDSGSLGETYFDGVTWRYEDGHTLEPVYRAGLKTFDKRYESWNYPPTKTEAVQSIFLASALASNGVATWEDEFPATAYLASFAYRFQAQLDQPSRSEVAIFYPHASVEHNTPIQANDEILLGGQHYWYLGLGYLMAGLNLNYDVLYGADGLVRDDTFATPSASDYGAIFVAETRQATDEQFSALADYVNAGGKLIVMGSDVLRYDELGRDKAASRSLGSTTYDGAFGAVGERSYGSGSVEVVSLNPLASNTYSYHADAASIDISAIRASVSAALPEGLSTTRLSGADRLRALTYRDDGDNSLIVHLVNHAFSNGGSALATQSDVQITTYLPANVPAGAVANYVTAESGNVQSLDITDNGDGTISLTIPTVATWGILRIGSALEAPAMPNIAPMAELTFLFDYEEFSSNPDRNLVFQAADDRGLEKVTFQYQQYDAASDSWGEWTAGASLSLNGVTRVDAESASNTIGLNFADIGEGRYRAQLVATDIDGAESDLVLGLGYDTIVGFDTVAPDASSIMAEVLSGPESGSAITTPSDVTLSISNVVDTVSGVRFVNSKFSGASFDTAPEAGDDYEEGYTRVFTGPEDGQYGTYAISARFEDYAENLSEWMELYSYTYGLPPTIIEATGSHTTSNGEALSFGAGDAYSVIAGETVTFGVDATNVLDNETVQWFKNGELVEGATERSLNLGGVSSSDAGTYYVVIQNAVGSVQSESFELVVNAPLSITEFSRDPADGKVNQGGSFTLTVVAEGAGTLTYQWEAQILQNDWAVIEGATEATYTVTNATRADHQGNYRVTVTDESGSVLSNRTLRIEVTQTSGGGGGNANDGDNDGVQNGNDNCPNDANSDQSDLDGDGIGDVCDSDIDGDGASNQQEAEAGTDPNDPNSTPQPTTADQDDDGVDDDSDNCLVNPNPLQADLDGDGTGDACDMDIDGDGFSNVDEGEAGTDPKDASSFPEAPVEDDQDDDGVTDDTDNCPVNPNPLQADLDGDGTGDACDMDIDGDGFSNVDEGEAGTDPKDASSFPEASAEDDQDNDGVVDALDLYPEDASKSANTPYYFTFEGVIDFVSESSADKRPHQVRAGEAYQYTIVVDNHGGSSMSGEWARADIEFLLLAINDNEDASVLVDVPNIRTPFGIGSSLGGPSLTLETDANGALIKTWNDAIFLGLSDDIRLDWYQTYGWLDSEIGVAQRLQARTDTVADAVGLYSDQSSFSFTGVNHSTRIEVGAEWSGAQKAECDGLTLDTQASVDAVLSRVCARVTGDVVIQGAEIQDLSPLRVIRTIDGELVIGSDTTMPTLNGLQGLSHVGGKAVVDTDGDYHPDFMDAFPNDPAAAFDTDQDGFPNDWLPGYFSSTEDPDLVADADDDNDGVTDFEDAFPLDASESSDIDGDGIGDGADLDDDGDLVGDESDNCRAISNEDQLDFDSDGKGDVCDSDDDNDGFSDEEETLAGSDPFDDQACPSTCFTFDIDGSGDAKALTDGLLVIRHLFGFSGSALVANASAPDAARTDAESITSYLAGGDGQLDIDGDGDRRALTDGLLLIRYLFGFTGDALITGAVGDNAERTTSAEIEAYIGARLPAQ